MKVDITYSLIPQTKEAQMSAIKQAKLNKLLAFIHASMAFIALCGVASIIVGLSSMSDITSAHSTDKTGLDFLIFGVTATTISFLVVAATALVPNANTKATCPILFLRLNTGTQKEKIWTHVTSVEVTRRFFLWRYVSWSLENGETIRRRLKGTFWPGGEIAYLDSTGLHSTHYEAYDKNSLISVPYGEQEYPYELNRITHLMREA